MTEPASASTPAAPKSLAKDLLPPSYAKKVGFTKVVEKASTTSKTGEKSCPNGAQEIFKNASGKAGMESEIVACTTSKAAAALLGGVATGTSATSSSPPKRLGSSAIERAGGGSSPSYAIYWRRGAILELIGITFDLAASTSSTTTTTTAPAPPITPAEQKLLSKVAVAQNKRLR
ncbi:MAG: hypothetical protein ACRDVW_08785 [Acidimicrobiales bacterium]